MRGLVILGVVLGLAGCDKLTGAADQKIADAEAIGFACRVSGKTPEVCMKENEAQAPSSVLDGWKTADEDIKSGKLDPGMSNAVAAKPEEGATGEAAKPAEEAKGDEKAGGDKPKADAAKEVKPDAKHANEKAKPEKPAEEGDHGEKKAH